MQIQIKAGRLQMGAEALEEISRALKREAEEILSARRTLERQSVFSHELRQLRSIEASIEEDERRLERLSYGLTRIDSLYQQAERSALEPMVPARISRAARTVPPISTPRPVRACTVPLLYTSQLMIQSAKTSCSA